MYQVIFMEQVTGFTSVSRRKKMWAQLFVLFINLQVWLRDFFLARSSSTAEAFPGRVSGVQVVLSSFTGSAIRAAVMLKYWQGEDKSLAVTSIDPLMTRPFDVCSWEVKSTSPLDSQTKHKEHIGNLLVMPRQISAKLWKLEWFGEIPIIVCISSAGCRKATEEKLKEESGEVKLGRKHTSRQESSRVLSFGVLKNSGRTKMKVITIATNNLRKAV